MNAYTDAAADDTGRAVGSALEAARRERDALASRLEELDSLIEQLEQVSAAGGGGAGGATRKRTRKQSKATKKSSKKSAAKKATRGRKAGGRKAGAKKAGGRKRSSRSAGQGEGRTDRIVDIITKANEPLTTGQVRAQLAVEEPDVTSQLVSASLAYARRKGRLTRTDDGRWSANTAS